MKTFPVIAVAVLLAACGDDRVAGKGVASETTNGTIVSGILLDASGAPAARVRLDLRDPAADAQVDFDTTAPDGSWSVRAPHPGRFLVWAVSGSVGVSSWLSVGEQVSRSVGPLAQTSMRPLSGHVRGWQDGGNLVVRLPGLGLETVVKSDSSWVFPGVPEGPHLVRIVSSTWGVVGEAAATTWKSDTLHLATSPSVLLDDFEGTQGQSLLQPILDGAWWGRWNDTSMVADSSRTWAGTSGLSTDSGAWSGRSLRVPMRVGDTIPSRPDLQRSAGLQLKIGGDETADSGSVWHDLSVVDSIVFQAKGTGSFTLRFKARQRSAPARTGWLSASFVLSPGWTRFVFRPSDFASSEGLVWSDAHAREILWVTRDSTADLWLDDIRLHGPRLTDLLRR